MLDSQARKQVPPMYASGAANRLLRAFERFKGTRKGAWVTGIISRTVDPFLLLLLNITYYWKIVLTNQFTWLDSPDMTNMVLPRFEFMTAEWHHLRFPVWDPFQWAGQPFLGAWTGAAMPLNWPLFILGGFDQGKMRLDLMNWYIVIIHWLGAVFCYWLCRYLGRSRTSSILAGCLFAFGGYFGNTDWPEIFTGCVWIPLVFLFLLRAHSGERPIANAALAGVFCGMSWLSGHHQAPLYLMVAAVGTQLALALTTRQFRQWRLAIVTGLFAVLTGGLQLLPGQEYGKLAHRWAGAPNPLTWQDKVPYSVHLSYSLLPQDVLGILMPHVAEHVSLLIGLTGSILVFAALFGCWAHRPVKIFTLLAAAGIWFSLAGLNVFYGLLYALFPMFEMARVPARTAMLFSFAVAPLAAFGLDWLRERGRGWATGVMRIGGIAFCAVFLMIVFEKVSFVERVSILGLVAFFTAGLLAAGNRWLGVGLIALSMIELQQARLFMPATSPVQTGGLRKLYEHRDIVEFLRAQPKPFRVEYSDDILYNFGQWHLMEAYGGFGAGFTSNLFMADLFEERTRDLFGVTYSIDKKPSRGNQQEVFSGSSGLKVYRNLNAFPRAWVVHEVRQAVDRAKAREILAGIDARRIAVTLARAPPLETCEGPEDIHWEDRGTSRVRFQVEARCRGLVVVGDTWYPGWSATVDGKASEVIEVDGALRGVAVERGKHIVEMSFQSSTYYAGWLMTLGGIAAALFLRWRTSA